MVTTHMCMTNGDREECAKHASCTYICGLYMSQYLPIRIKPRQCIIMIYRYTDLHLLLDLIGAVPKKMHPLFPPRSSSTGL